MKMSTTRPPSSLKEGIVLQVMVEFFSRVGLDDTCISEFTRENSVNGLGGIFGDPIKSM